MIYFENPQQNDPHINLAVEEFLLRHIVIDQPILFFYVNEPSIVVGRNQNVFEEINFSFARNHHLPVLRRLSGGGTVYHDLGNVNYSLIAPDQELLNDYSSFTRPVLNALRRVGLTPELKQRSSIFVGGKKVSGNAQYATAGRLVSHGTLLFNSDLAKLRSAIQPQLQQIESRAVRSIRSHVVNLCDLLEEGISPDMVKDLIREEFLGGKHAVTYQLSVEDWRIVQEIAQERYRSWEWNIGRSPKFSTTRRTQTAVGELVLEIQVDKGHIQLIRLVGLNPTNNQLVNILGECLSGIRYDPQEITRALRTCGVETWRLGLSEDQLISLIY